MHSGFPEAFFWELILLADLWYLDSVFLENYDRISSTFASVSFSNYLLDFKKLEFDM